MSEQENDIITVDPVVGVDRDWQHWWREPIAGMLSLGIGCYDTWKFGRDAGLTSSLDEILVVGGIVLIAGSRKLFMGANGNGQGNGRR